MNIKLYLLFASGLLLVMTFAISETKPTCQPVNPEEPVCIESKDCEGLPHVDCVGEFKCMDGNCVWNCNVTCTKEGEKYSFNESECCEGLVPVPECIETEGGCACTKCGCSICTKCGNGDCGLGENKCNCPEDCAEEMTECEKNGGKCIYFLDKCEIGYKDGIFACKSKSDRCCVPECKALDPYAYGACEMVLGWVYDGKTCTLSSGCSCEPDCDYFFDSKEECENTCFPTDKKCVVSGCSSDICASEPMNSICIWKPEYACLKYSECGLYGINGTCGWKQTEEFLKCLKEIKNSY